MVILVILVIWLYWLDGYIGYMVILVIWLYWLCGIIPIVFLQSDFVQLCCFDQRPDINDISMITMCYFTTNYYVYDVCKAPAKKWA